MRTMMMLKSADWNARHLLRVGVLAFALTLTACGGGGNSSTSAGTVLSTIQALIATGTATDLQTAMDLLIANQDTVSAADFQTMMDALIAAG